MARRYKAFISYSWADKDWGGWLHRSLELYRTPKALVGGATPIGAVPASLHPIFKDREEEAAGHGVGAAIEAALAASEFLIVICSPRSAASTWVNREIAWFKTHKDKSRILALIVDGEPGASATLGREAEECFPKTLTRKVGADLQPTEEMEDAPLAADARPEGDGRRGSKLKLAAALLGVGLDALVRRDERRRTIHRRLVTSAAFALAAVLGGLSIFAFNQRDAAVFARNDAVKARDDAEGLIELILTDLKSDLEGYGTLKSVTAIGDRAIGYYEGQDVKALTPDQLGRRARVLLMLGEADNKRGDLSAALARYETAAATTSEQLARDPENPQRIFDHAQSVFWVGYIAWQRGDRAAAKRQFTEYHEHAQALVASDPANEDWQAELEYAYSNLGTLAMDDGDAAEAEGWFRKSLEVSTALLAEKPEDVDRVLAAGQSYAWLANAYNRQAKLTDAERARKEEIQIYGRAIAENSANAALKSRSAIAFYSMVQIMLSKDVIEGADRPAISAVAISSELLEKQQDSAERLELHSSANSIAGELALRAGRLDAARSYLAAAESSALHLTSKEDDVSLWTGKLLARSRVAMAKLAEAENDAVRAIALYREVADSLRPMLRASETDPIVIRFYCEALAGRARLSDDFNNAWAEIVSSLGAEQKRHGPEALGLLAEAYRRTGETGQAKAIAAKLYAAGYRRPDFMAALAESPELKPTQTDAKSR